MAKKLLKLVWVDEQGEPYHEEVLPTRKAHTALKAARVVRVKVTTQYGSGHHHLSIVSYAQAKRSTRALVGEIYGSKNTVIITPHED